MGIAQPNAPVIVGVGEALDRTDDLAIAKTSNALMADALRMADADAGGGWLQRADWFRVVDQLSFSHLGPANDHVAEALGMAPASSAISPSASGHYPLRFLSEAANLVAAGEVKVAVIAGGEALRTAKAMSSQPGAENFFAANMMRAAAAANLPPLATRYGVFAPADFYPFYENACRAAWGQSLAEAQAESAAMWAGMSQVAACVETAWLHEPVSVEQVLEPGDDNRMIAFPYTKLMNANSAVNMGAGLIVTSYASAREAGVPDDGLVFIGRAAAADAGEDYLARERFDHSTAMETALAGALGANGLSIEDIDCVELYSCFPCVPKMARRVIGWPVEKPITVFGGLTFGGGPLGNYMSHAVAAMTRRLRGGENKGMLFANGGYATNNHALVLSREPFAESSLPFDFDMQANADAAKGAPPLLDPSYEGPGEIETFTALYGRDGAPRLGVIIARAPTGVRFLAQVPASDPETLSRLADPLREAVGAEGDGFRGEGGLVQWRFRRA